MTEKEQIKLFGAFLKIIEIKSKSNIQKAKECTEIVKRNYDSKTKRRGTN